MLGLKDNGSRVLVKADAGWVSELAPWHCHVQNDRDDALDDLVKSDYLHEAGYGLALNPCPCTDRRVSADVDALKPT